MAIKITHDANAPTASIELVIKRPLPDYDLDKVEATIPREVDPILASQGFKDLLDEVRSILEQELGDGGLEIAQLTGAICHDNGVHRPGIWVVVRETGAAPGQTMSPAAQAKVAAAAEAVRTSLQLS
jgi:hypothetical protein